MNIKFGKHSGMAIELLMLREPKYICWLLHEDYPSAEMRLVQAEARELIKLFDNKPIIEHICWGSSCIHPPTRCTVHMDNLSMVLWWCPTCSPSQTGADLGKLYYLNDYSSAIGHVMRYCGDCKADHVTLIKKLARARGLPKRVGKAQALAFFHG